MSPEQQAILPGQPHDPQGLTFREPWQAQAFAMTLELHRQGVFTWPQWAGALGRRIAEAPVHVGIDAADSGDTYYLHWLEALEGLVAESLAGSASELIRYRDAWRSAAERTPHGLPVELQETDFAPASST